jgi:hypothetical protein
VEADQSEALHDPRGELLDGLGNDAAAPVLLAQPVAQFGRDALDVGSADDTDTAHGLSIYLDGEYELIACGSPPCDSSEELPGIFERVGMREPVTQAAGDLRVIGMTHEGLRVLPAKWTQNAAAAVDCKFPHTREIMPRTSRVWAHRASAYNFGMATPAPGQPGGPPNQRPTEHRTFVDRITDGLEAEQLWAQFKADARATYGLYKREIGAEDIPVRHRSWEMAKSFFWAVMRKLTPVRRVMLLSGIIFALIPTAEFQTGDQRTSISFHFLGALILLALLILEISDRVTMKRDLEIAREIQLWLVPGAPPQVPGVDIAFVNRPANTVAGDYYDVLPRDGGNRVLFVVADVAGKSIPAALLMATFQASLKTLMLHTNSLAELIQGVNDYACAHSNEGRRFTTAFLGELDPVTKTFSYVNAGHNAPVLRRMDGRIERLEVGGLPFGITSTAPYSVGTVQLAAGDMLLIFTDGLIEAVNERGEEYGEDRMLAQMGTLQGSSAKESVNLIMSDLARFIGMAHQHDDITCLMTKINS